MIEVELKAHVKNRSQVLAALNSFASPAGEVDKADEYWHGPDWRIHRGSRGFRIRSESGKATVTFKTKRSEGGIEINHEREFEISDSEVFEEFVERLGCEPFYQKRKQGLRFLAAGEGPSPTATIELIEVVGLGDFIEIEILLPSEDPAALALAQGEIRSLLAKSGVSEQDIESRFYSELLIEAGLVARP